MSSRTRRRAIRGMAIVAVAFGAPAPARAEVRLDAGDGQQLVVDSSPLRFGLRDGQGRETVASVPAGQGPAVRPPGLDGPQPLEPAGSLGGFPALGWVVGAQAGATYPLPLFTGNRLFGAELGTLVSATGVAAAERAATGTRIVLTTDDPLHPTALLQVDRLPGGGVRLRATPPEGLRPVSTVFSLASPGDEGLYGLGGRKDAFDQRGRLRNVWAEEQNTGDQRVDALLGPDASGTAGADYTFPNGPQAAYYPQALLFGSRGWAAWVAQDELQRVDLAASRPDVVRWAVASTRLDLRLAGGGLEAAARSHSADVGRAPPAPDWALQPWIDVINQGEGEAAPNGAGFSGGARVKRDLEEVVARSRATGLPLGVLGVEGWQSVPDGPAFFAALRAQGLHLSAYWNPFTSSGTPAYADAVRRNVLVKDATGRPVELVNNRGGRASVVTSAPATRRRSGPSRSSAHATSASRAGWRTSASTSSTACASPTAHRPRRCTTATRCSTTGPGGPRPTRAPTGSPV